MKIKFNIYFCNETKSYDSVVVEMSSNFDDDLFQFFVNSMKEQIKVLYGAESVEQDDV